MLSCHAWPDTTVRQALSDESFELLRRSRIHNNVDTIHIIRQALPDESFITSSHSSGLHRHDLLSHSLMRWIPRTAMIQVYRNNFKRPINFHRIWSIAQCGSRNITLSISARVHRDRHDLLIAFKWIAKLMTVLAKGPGLSHTLGKKAGPWQSQSIFIYSILLLLLLLLLRYMQLCLHAHGFI